MDEITAEYSVADLLPQVELKVRTEFTIAAKTDMGRVRDNNEDKFEFFCPEDEASLASRGCAFVVCDGMGGHNAGQIASELSIKTFLDSYFQPSASDAGTAAQNAVSLANRYVKDVGDAIPSRRGMGTTFTGLMLVQDRAVLAQVGDSRCYRLREGRLEQVSPEHTWIEEMVASGTMTREEASNHPYRHMITRALGQSPTVEVDVRDWELQVGDIYLLCSDGLTNHVSDAELLEVLSSEYPARACITLVGKALNDGGSDNCTALIVRIDTVEPCND